MNFFEYDAELSISTQAAMDYYDNFSKELERKSLDDQKVLKEPKKGSPSWTALWFLHNSYRYGSFLLGNNLISA